MTKVAVSKEGVTVFNYYIIGICLTESVCPQGMNINKNNSIMPVVIVLINID